MTTQNHDRKIRFSIKRSHGRSKGRPRNTRRKELMQEVRPTTAKLIKKLWSTLIVRAGRDIQGNRVTRGPGQLRSRTNGSVRDEKLILIYFPIKLCYLFYHRLKFEYREALVLILYFPNLLLHR